MLLTMVTPQGKTEIMIQMNLLSKLQSQLPTINGGKWAIITDTNVFALYGEKLSSLLTAQGVTHQWFPFPAGEEHKTLETYTDLCHALIKENFSREDGVLAFGGGLTGDMAGFVAATLFRGMPLVMLPTTLLSQVDSCIGNKVGIDLAEGKNLLGTLYAPKKVLVDPFLLKTLPEKEVSSGMAEVIKYGLIKDSSILDEIEEENIDFVKIIEKCLKIKAEVVEEDPEDRGLRHILNFGHTYGHAYEKQEGFTGLSHGQAVAAGMMEMLRWEEKHGYDVKGVRLRTEKLLKKCLLPTQWKLKDREILRQDKKRAGDEITIAIIEEIGKASIKTIPISELYL